MERSAGSGSGPLDTVSIGEGIEKRPDGVKPFGRAGATDYYNFRSSGQGCPLEEAGFF